MYLKSQHFYWELEVELKPTGQLERDRAQQQNNAGDQGGESGKIGGRYNQHMLYTYIKCSKPKTKNISGPSFLRKHPEQAATGASGLHYATLRSDRQGIWTKKFSMNADKNHKEKMGYDLGSCTTEIIMMLNPSTFPSQGWGTWQRLPLRTFQLI